MTTEPMPLIEQAKILLLSGKNALDTWNDLRRKADRTVTDPEIGAAVLQAQEDLKPPKAKAGFKQPAQKPRKTTFKPKTKEHWYILPDFPNYVISSQGRCGRAIAGPRSAAGTVLTPRIKYPRPNGWRRAGKSAYTGPEIAYRLYRETDGKTECCDRTAASLLLNVLRGKRRPVQSNKPGNSMESKVVN